MGIHKTATISKTAEIDTTARIGAGVIIEGNVRIASGVNLMPNVYVYEGTDIGPDTEIHIGAVIGGPPQDHEFKCGRSYTKIGKKNIIREYVTIHRGTEEESSTIIGDNNFIMVQAHIGHNCIISNNVIIANGALLAGRVHVDECAFISGNVVFHQFCRVGAYSMIGGFTGVNKDVPPYMLVRGPSAIRGVNLVGLRRGGFSREIIREIKDAYKTLYLSGKTQKEALSIIKSSSSSKEVSNFVSFIENSKRGICVVRFKKEEYF